MNKLGYKLVSNGYANYNTLYVDNKSLQEIFIDMTEDIDFFEWLTTSINDLDPPDKRYIWHLIDNKINCNFPILLCGDDMDFTCTIVVVKVEYQQDYVIWKSFGSVDKSNYSYVDYYNSGIKDIDSWSAEDWEKYQDIVYDLLYDNYFFSDWTDKHCQEELYRRNCNYIHKYLNNDDNIHWFGNLNFKFDINQYFDCLNSIRKELNL